MLQEPLDAVASIEQLVFVGSGVKAILTFYLLNFTLDRFIITDNKSQSLFIEVTLCGTV
jgi:hypothetical protein